MASFLGLIFALAFVRFLRRYFVDSLIPLALSSDAGISLSFVYVIGTGLPVLVFTVAIVLGITSMSHWFNKITKLEYCARRITGIIFILIGFYYIEIYF